PAPPRRPRPGGGHSRSRPPPRPPPGRGGGPVPRRARPAVAAGGGPRPPARGPQRRPPVGRPDSPGAATASVPPALSLRPDFFGHLDRGGACRRLEPARDRSARPDGAGRSAAARAGGCSAVAEPPPPPAPLPR